MSGPTQPTPAPAGRRAEVFTYLGYRVEPDANRVVCRYRLDDREFTEVIGFPAGGDWAQPAVEELARLIFLLTGVSYYKAGAPPLIDLGGLGLTDLERAFLTEFYLDGLGEFAYRNGLDLSGLEIRAAQRRAPVVGYRADAGRPLLPFGGGLDSIVSVELVRPRVDDAALFVVNRPGDTFDAIEQPAAVTGLPVVRAERLIDSAVLRSRELGFLNGHVPVTGIISAIGLLAAALQHRDALVMSNEWSASSATLQVGGRAVNHQYSKSEVFEAGLRGVLAEALGGADLQYFSLLRPFTELWIAERFAGLPQYLRHFRSCNRAFHIDRAARWDRWCGVCEKCCFIDLILAPFLDAADLAAVFDGREPLRNGELIGTFRRLLALTPDAKPWECVGDEVECRVAARLAAARPDRAGSPVLATLVADAAEHHDPAADQLLRPIGRHFIPDRYAPQPLLV